MESNERELFLDGIPISEKQMKAMRSLFDSRGIKYDLEFGHNYCQIILPNQADSLSDILAPITRLEYIDFTKDSDQGGGRNVVFKSDQKRINPSIQDANRTLKLFIDYREEDEIYD